MITVNTQDFIRSTIFNGTFTEKILHEDENEIIGHTFKFGTFYDDEENDDLTFYIFWPVTEPENKDQAEHEIFKYMIDSCL